MAENRPQPEGRTAIVHESTIIELQLELELGHLDAAREIVGRLAAFDERAQLREIREEAYRRMMNELRHGNREAAKRHRGNMRKAAEALKELAI